METFYMTDLIPLLGLPNPPYGQTSYYVQCPCCDENPRKRHLNINLAKDQVKPVWARKVVSCSELNDLDHYQNSQLTVWVIHLQNLCKLAHKFDPCLVEGSPLLKKELEYLSAKALNNAEFEK